MREQRLVFGEVAELYDRHRPSYPPQLIDDLVAVAKLDGTRPVLEVGAGTGKATSLFAQRGIPVVAIEPSEPMAAVARRNLSVYPGVELEQSDFERWDPAGREFPLLFSAQAWHWVQRAAGYVKAREVLSEHGILAAFWNRIAWDQSEAREALLAAYERTAPDLSTVTPMHPANLSPDGDQDWHGEIAAADGFARAEVRYYEWEQGYSAEDYIGLLATTSDIRLLDEARRATLFGAVAEAFAEQHGALTLPMHTRLCLAWRR